MAGGIALLDYGAGNLASVRKAFTVVGADLVTPQSPAELHGADAIVVPGVGHFAATAALDAAWRSAICEALERGRPVLGICLGLQWLFDASEEAPDLPGLGAIEGVCRRLPPGQKVPHVGWNTFDVRQASRVLAGLPPRTYAYFTHTYAAPVTDACAAVTTYGAAFAAVVERGNLFGVQFHPEKSGSAGLRILSNFVGLSRRAGSPAAGEPASRFSNGSGC